MNQDINKILNQSLESVMSMSRQELARETSKLVSAANKRLRRMEKRGISTPATAYIYEHGGKFSVAGKNLEQVREEYQRVKGFLESETSTFQGFRKWEKGLSNTLKERTGIDYNSFTEDEKRLFWKAYSKLEELDAANVYGARYKESINKIYDSIKAGKLTEKNVNRWAISRSKKIYRESQKEWNDLQSPFDL